MPGLGSPGPANGSSGVIKPLIGSELRPSDIVGRATFLCFSFSEWISEPRYKTVAMIDALPNIESVYAKWEDKNPHFKNGKLTNHSESSAANGYDATIANGREAWKSRFSKVSAPPPRRVSRRQANNKSRSAMIADYHMDYSLGASFKTAPSYHPKAGRLRPYSGLCCDCMPDSKNYLFTESIKNSGVTDVLRVNTGTSDNDWITRTFCHISFVMRQRLEHKYPDLTMAVLTSPRLLEAIQMTVQEADGSDARISSLRQQQETKARSVLVKMSASISNRLIRFTGWFLHKLLGRLLSSIVIHKGQMSLLQQFCKKEVPVIFLPTHRSHLDYILLTFVLFNYNIKAPYVAAGENLLIPFFGSLMRGLGGFFIRRKLDNSSKKKDYVYRAVLHSYMEELLRNNEFLEFFVEGGRTRSGKPVHPKGGLLSVVIDAYANGVIPEAYIVPVSISYDKLVDGNFVKEQMGEPKVYETFWRAVLAIYKVLMGRYGIVRMDFAQPFSLKEYLEVSKFYPSLADVTFYNKSTMSALNDIDLCSSENTNKSLKLCASDESVDQHGREARHIVQCLAEHVVYASVSAQSILSTHLLAFILLCEFRQGADLEVIKAAFKYLQSEILMRNHDVSFTGDIDMVLLHAQYLLGDRLVHKVTETDGTGGKKVVRLIPATTLPHVLELSYYANVVSPLLSVESVLVNTIYSIMDFEEWTELSSTSHSTFSYRHLMQEATVLCSILKYEFIFCPPCQSLDIALKAGFDRLRNSDMLITDEAIIKDCGVSVQDIMWAKRFAKQLQFEDYDSEPEDWTTDNEVCMVNKEPDLRKKFMFFKRVLSPILETYYVAACHLVQLLEHDVPENDFVKSLHKILKERVATGTSSYAESAAMDTLRNAILGFKNAGVIQLYNEASMTMCCLTEDYNSEESLFIFIRRLESYQE